MIWREYHFFFFSCFYYATQITRLVHITRKSLENQCGLDCDVNSNTKHRYGDDIDGKKEVKEEEEAKKNLTSIDEIGLLGNDTVASVDNLDFSDELPECVARVRCCTSHSRRTNETHTSIIYRHMQIHN